MSEIRDLAEQRLAAREAKHGPVANRERYLEAAMRGIENDRSAMPAAPKAPKTDKRPYCARCDGNGWLETVPEGSYEYVVRCPDCDHGRVSLRSADEPRSTPEVARAHLAVLRDQLSRLQAKHSVRGL